MAPVHDRDFPPLPSQKKEDSKAIKRVPKEPSPKKPGAMTTLNDLPNELIYQIIEYLPWQNFTNSQLPTILSLSRVNHRFHSLVMGSLYSEYNNFFGHPYLFLRTLICNREIAEMVRSLKVMYGPGVHEDRRTYVPSVSDRRDIKASLKALEIPNWKSWATDCNDEDTDQEMLYAAILMHTPNITSLDIHDGEVPYQVPKWINVIKQSVGGNSFGCVHHFTQLKSIRIDVGTLRIHHLVTLFRLWSLRRLAVIGLIETETDTGSRADSLPFKWPVPVRSSSIEELLLPDSFIETLFLTTMMDTCRRLKNFQYAHRDERWGDREGWRYRPDGSLNGRHATSSLLDYPQLSAALLRHHQTLERIEVSDDIGGVCYDFKATSSLETLAEFKRVHHLKAPLSAFDLVRVSADGSIVWNLPPSLLTLQIIVKWDDPQDIVVPALKQLAAQLRMHVPLLKELLVEVQASMYSYTYNWWEQIRKPWVEAGLNDIIEIRRIQESEDESESDSSSVR